MSVSTSTGPGPARTTLRSVLRSIVMLDDTPHSIALGTAIGMFVGLTPTMGIQMAIVLVIALLASPFFRFNKVAGCATVYITNPLTAGPVYFFEYWVGTLLVGGWMPYDRFVALMTCRTWSEWWDAIRRMVLEIGTPLLVGTTIVSIVGGVLTYPAMLWFLKRVRPARATPAEPVAGSR